MIKDLSSSVLLLALVLMLPAGETAAQGLPERAHPARGLKLETIDWITDGTAFLDQRRFKASLTAEERAIDREAILESALERARKQGKPVLWFVNRALHL